MKALIASLCLIPSIAIAECDVRSASTLAHERDVGQITNLVKTKGQDWCTVNFDLEVDGVKHHLEETDRGLEQVESLCYYATERAKRNLLLTLGGKFKTEAVTVCKEGTAPERKIKIGDTILESEVGKSKVDIYFNYQNTRCRLFQETYSERRELKVYYGVICQTDNSGANWIVVDKW
jgi:hypothetical protein